MLRDVIPFEDVWKKLNRQGLANDAVGSFVRFVERRLGASFVFDAGRLPVSDKHLELLDLLALAEKLKRANIISSYGPVRPLPDEPPFLLWSADSVSHFVRGEALGGSGASIASSRDALAAALAEATERFVWANEFDYFSKPRIAAAAEIIRAGYAITPERFTGFSTEQRSKNRELRLAAESRYLWVQGHSWVSGESVWLPAQIVSGSQEVQAERRQRGEPLVLTAITHGLATRPARREAVLHGALEIVERDAFMIAWLNQLSVPRFELRDFASRSKTLARLLRQCRRYRLRVEAIRLVTDAPAYAVCTIVFDETGQSPHVALGLRAHRDPVRAVEGALLEALRTRARIRRRQAAPDDTWDPATSAVDIGHTDRLRWWAEGARARQLAFLTAGEIRHFDEPWEQDSDDQHLERLITWCRKRGYELASVALTKSRGNLSPWHIEMVVIPELQPLHLNEKLPYLGGARRTEIPRQFGYTPRDHPFTGAPHPFA